MKNVLKALFKIIITVFFIVMVFVFGFSCGKNHVITDSKISMENNHIFISIDGKVYVHNID